MAVVLTSPEVIYESPTYHGVVTFANAWLVSTDLTHRRAYCIVLDRKCLQAKRQCIAEFHEFDDLIRVQDGKQYGKDVARIIYTFQQAICPSLDIPEPKKKARIMQTEEAAAAPAPPEIHTLLVDVCTDNNNTLDKVGQYIEEIKDANEEVIGWRLWYVVQDATTFHLDERIMQVFEENRYRNNLEKAQTKTLDKGSLNRLRVTSKEEWLECVDSYHCLPGNTILARDRSVAGSTLLETRSPAHVANIFSFESSKQIIQGTLPNAKPTYIDPLLYCGNNRLRFLHGARYVERCDRDPCVFYNIHLVEDASSRIDLVGLDVRATARTQGKRRKVIKERCALQTVYTGDHVEDVLAEVKLSHVQCARAVEERVRAYVENSPWGKVPSVVSYMMRHLPLYIPPDLELDTYEQFRTSKASVDRLKTLFSTPERLDPGPAKCVKWLQEKMRGALVDKKPGWCPMSLKHIKLDAGMSLFASAIARMGVLVETLGGFLVYHQEMVGMFLWSLGAFDSRKDTLFTHVFMTGPPGSGKSEVLKRLRKMLVSDTVRKSSYETAKAYTVDQNFNGLIFGYDELPRSYLDFGDGGQGDPMIKEMLSSSEVTTTSMTHNGDEGTRTSFSVTCKLRCPIFGCSNQVAERGPEAVMDRFWVISVHAYERGDKDAQLADMDKDVDDYNLKNGMYDDFHLIQSIVACMEQAIRASFLPDVDLVGANLRWNLIRGELSRKGVPLNARKNRHVMNQVRSCALFEAAYRLYFTTEIFPADHVFSYEDVLKAAPFLYATEEHLVYVLTMGESTITETSVDQIVKAIVGCSKENGKTTFASHHGEVAVSKGAVDHNTLFMSTPGAEQTTKSVIEKAAIKISHYIKKTENSTLLHEQVQSILTQLLGVSAEVGHYDGEAEEKLVESTLKSVSVLQVSTYSANQVGLELNRAYAMGATNRKDSVLQLAINATRTKHTCERVLITGRTIRTQKEMVPYLFKTMKVVPNMQKETYVMNVDFRSPGYERSVLGEDFKAEKQSMVYKKLDKDIDTHCYGEFLRRNHLRPASVHFPVCNTWQVATYPEADKNEYLRCSRLNDPSAATATATTTTTTATTTTTNGGGTMQVGLADDNPTFNT
jgi:hypothetical protein